MVFIVIEGLDASGKSTQGENILHLLKNRNFTVCLRSHPSLDNIFGKLAKQYLLIKGRKSHLKAAIFYLIDVMRSIVIYMRKKYNYLIFVRYLMGTAYLPSPFYRIVYNIFAWLVPTPDITIYLDITPEEANKRIQLSRKNQEMFETLDQLKNIRKKAYELAIIGNWIIIDANKPDKDITMEINNLLQNIQL